MRYETFAIVQAGNDSNLDYWHSSDRDGVDKLKDYLRDIFNT